MYESFMRRAIALSCQGVEAGGGPFGAVVVKDGEIIGEGMNQVVPHADPTAHAEIQVMRTAARNLGNERLIGTTLFVSLEPCAMCAGAIAMARVSRLVFAACDPKGGAVLHGPRFFEQPTCHHRPLVVQTQPHAVEAGEILRAFFRARRT